MYIDVTELRDFYADPLGGVVRRIIGHRVRARWRNVKGLNVYGVGYAAPYLGMFRGEAASVGALMPAGQGVITWPAKGPYQSALIDEDALPLCDGSVNCLLMVHCLEMSEMLRNLLRESWRVLAPEGRLLLIVPNRRGVWARLEHTPFGHGRPFSRGQLSRLLQQAMFEPFSWNNALFMPPFQLKLFMRSAVAWERVGIKLWPAFSGLLIVEAKKSVYSAIPKKKLKVIPGHLVPSPATPFQTGNT